MKKILLSAVIVVLGTLASYNAAAQQALTAKKFEKPNWKRVVLFSFKPNTAERGREIIKNYFVKASAQSGVPGPSLALDMMSGEWDMMVVFDMKGGIEEMNWEVSPDDVKWMATLSTIAGGSDKAKALTDEFNSLINRSTSYIAKTTF